jgi:hypothetical protein
MLASRQRHDTVIMCASPTSNSAQSSSKNSSQKTLAQKTLAETLPGKNSSAEGFIQVAFSRLPYIYGLPIDANLLRCIRELGHNSLLLVNGTALYGCRG